MSKVSVSDHGVNLEGLNKEEIDFLSKISKHNIFGILGDHVAVWRWKNAKKIIEKARKFSEVHKISLKTIPSKFLVEFLESASLEEEESVQDIWAKILASEGREPNSFSIRTIGALKLMNKNDAETFSSLFRYLINYKNEVFLPNNDNLFKKYSLNFDKIIQLEELGLINLNPMLSLQARFNLDESNIFHTKNRVLIIRRKPENTEKEVSVKAYTLTTIGKQLFSVINDSEVNDSFVYDYALELKNQHKDFNITLHKVNVIVDGNINYKTEDILTEDLEPLSNSNIKT